MKSQYFLLVNPRAGDSSPTADELADAARERGIETRVLARGDDPAAAARDSRADVLGMAGGDGSLGAVAQVAIERDLGFVCVPFGTRNHFARDVGLDRDDPFAALAAFGSGREVRVDAARVGDRVFLNNVSLGVYAGLVHRRERHRRRREALARMRALLAVARHRHRLHAYVNGEPTVARVLLVGNNRYDLSFFTLGVRERLDEGELHLFAAAGLLPTTWDEESASTFTIELPQAHVRAAADGEPIVLETPIELESLPGALRLFLPPQSSTDDEPRGGTMHDQPKPTEEEQEQVHEGRQQEEEAMRYPEHQDPDLQRERAHEEGDA
ncbi:MAG TPA: diacylglycerol kinase family protein [Gaiellaceae bacterium]|nr:diacylglycerol kinase family protein [Gaiellaceae bacterium]